MKLIAVCTGTLNTYNWNSKEVASAILKRPIQIYKNKGQVEKSRAQELASINSMNEKLKIKFAAI